MLRHKTHAHRNIAAGLFLAFTLAGCFMNDPVEPGVSSIAPPPTGNNHSPQIWGTPPSVVKVSVAYSFTPQSMDPDDDYLSFRIDNKPAWLTFDSANGRISGMPLLGDEGNYNDIEITVSDGLMSTTLPAFSVSVESSTAPNMPPEIDGTPAGSVAVGDTYSFTPMGSDPDGDPLIYSIQNRPGWATFSASTGQLSGTPRPGDERSYPGIAITVSDNISTASLPAFSVTVTPANAAPTISGTPSSSVIAGAAYSFVPTAADPNNDPISFDVQNLPGWASFNTVTGELSGTPQANDIGAYSGIVISVTDGSLSSSLPPYSIDVVAPNSAPQISGTPSTSVGVGQNYSFTPTAFDADGDNLTFGIQNRPGWATFNSSTGQLSGTPQSGDARSYSGIAITVSDGTLASSLPAFSITVIPTNSPPQISGTPSTSVDVGQNYSFTPTAFDPDGDNLTFGIQNRPGWATFSSSTGRLSGTPQAGNARTFSGIVITASDGNDTASLPAFSITVNATNAAPTISGAPSSSVTAGMPYSFVPTASDPNNDPITFSVQNLPVWATFSSATGQLSGTPQASNVGTQAGIVISVSDGSLTSSLPPFSITVNSANSPPQINGTPSPGVDVGQSYSFTPTAFDPDGDNLTFSIQNRPGWATFSASTGRLSGTPQPGDERSYPGIAITVSDNVEAVSLPSFAITVTVPNVAPTISGTPSPSVTAGTAYSFVPTASDPNNDPITFSVQNRPTWASFSTVTGELSGTPQAGDIGIHGGIVISASDDTNSSSLPTFSINVVAANSPPQINGTPATSANVDQNYSFTPTAFDPDDDNLTFSIQNRPAWAQFDSTNGTLSGTPRAGDEATYTNISIRVSDGDLSDTLPNFTITVNPVSLGSATLNWAAPTENADGSPLMDLAGYKIYYGTSPGSYPNQITINNPGITTSVVDNLTLDTWYFVMTSFNASNMESDFSNVVTRTIN